MRRRTLLIVLGLAGWACAGTHARLGEESAPPFLFGEFVDDYGIRYSIRPDQWLQHPDARYHLREWHVGEEFVVAQNDPSNPSDGTLWTRIDWTPLGDPGEYQWAFCYAVYRATTREEAATSVPTQRDTPRTGCHGFPFSRMKRVDPGR